MALAKREKQFFCLTLITCFIYIIYMAIYIPFQKKSVSFKEEILDMQRELKKNSNIISQSKRLGKRYSVILAEFKQKGTAEQVMAAMLSDIEKVNEKIDIRISDKKPRKVKTADLYNQFSVSLILEGKLEDVIHFVYDLQSKPYLLRVDELRIDRKSRRTSALRCRLVLSRILIP